MQVVSVIVGGHVLALIPHRRAWAVHSHGHPGEGSYLAFLARRRIPPTEFVGSGYALWRSAGRVSTLSFAIAGVLILIQSI